MMAISAHWMMALWAVLGLAFSGAQAQSATEQFTGAQMYDWHCQLGYCVSGIYSPATQQINYTLVIAQGAEPVGWWSIAQGTEMINADMAICWINPDNATLVVSRRAVGGYAQPKQASLSAAQQSRPFAVNAASQKTLPGTTYWSWSMGVPEGQNVKNVQHIFATTNVSPKGNDSNASISKHKRHDQGIRLDFTKQTYVAGSVPAGLVAQPNGELHADASMMQNEANWADSGPSGSQPSNTLSHRLLIVHIAFMFAAFLVIFPLGILIARFGRTFFRIYKAHSLVQLVGLLFLFVGFFFGIGAVQATPYKLHWYNTHEKLGLSVFVLVIVQALLGAATHEVRKRTGNRWIGYIHIPWSLVTYGLAIWNMILGLKLWKTPMRAPIWSSYIIYAWVALLAAVYVAGFYKIRREIDHARQDKKDILEKRNPSSAPTSDANDDENASSEGTMSPGTESPKTEGQTKAEVV